MNEASKAILIKLLITIELCQMLSFSSQTLNKWIKEGRITKIKVAGSTHPVYFFADISKTLLEYERYSFEGIVNG